MKWNKKINSRAIPRVYETNERVMTRWPDGKPKSVKPAKLFVRCGDCKEKFEIHKFDRYPDISHDRDHDLIEMNGVLLRRDELKKILKWAGY